MINSYFIHKYDSLDSTQLEAKRLLKIGEIRNGSVIITKEQKAGTGRNNRIWHSNKGDLAITIMLKVNKDISSISQIAYIACISVGQSILHYNPLLNIQYKWVNDVLVDNRKISGILLEKYQYNFLLVGIGINLVAKQKLEHLNITSVKELGIKVPYNKFLMTLLKNFKLLYNHWQKYDFDSIKNQWLKHAVGLNQQIVVNFADSSLHGIFKGIDNFGCLQLYTDNKIQLIQAADIFIQNKTADETNCQ